MTIKNGGLAEEMSQINAYRLHKHVFSFFFFLSKEASLV